MARRRGRRWGSFAVWAVGGAAGLGAGTAVLSFLEPRRRARARETLERVSGSAREAGEWLGAAADTLPRPDSLQRRPGLLGAVLVARALLVGGVLRIPFGLLGLSTLARTAAASERGRAVLGAVTRAIRSAAAALRSVSRAGAERATETTGEPTILGPDANPA